MKKTIFVASLILIGLSSCKKIYNCDCTDNSKLTIENVSKDQAKESCDELEKNSAQAVPNTTCTLTTE